MAYNPYYPGPYEVYQDPYAGYDPYTAAPTPISDSKWEDPAKLNKAYLKKIQKDCVKKEFKDLKEVNLFLLEVVIKSIKFISENPEIEGLKEKEEGSFVTYVKFLYLPFMKLKDMEVTDIPKKIGEPEFSQLFQTIYTAAGRHETATSEEEVDEQTENMKTSVSGSDQREVANGKSSLRSSTQKDSRSGKKESTPEVEQGRSVLFSMPGLVMIQNLQQHPVRVKVVQCDLTAEGEKVEGAPLGVAGTILPQVFRQSVLSSAKPEAVLPVMAVENDSIPIFNWYGQYVGEVTLTIVLTCFGQAALNCMYEKESGYGYEHTMLLRYLKSRAVSEEDLFAVNPSLALEVLGMGLIRPSSKTSTEILQHCLATNMIAAGDEERRRALRLKDCDWYRMVESAQPRDSGGTLDSTGSDRYDAEMALLWMKHKQICRDLKTQQEENPKKSLFERLEEVQIQTGIAELETKNPFEEQARPSKLWSTGSSKKSRSSRGSVLKSSPRTSTTADETSQHLSY